MEVTDIINLLRPNIKVLVPYSSARNEYSGNEAILLDANENPYNSPYNRYPDPLQKKVKEKISLQTGVEVNKIFLGNGSDEAIDLLIRAFCIPGSDNIIITDPTYGMYEVCAEINDVEIRKVLLNSDFSLNSDGIFASADKNSKIVFLCSPNNPTANLLKEEDIVKVINGFKGIVIIDEAYIDFSASEGSLPLLNQYANLVILRTFSKAWGLAGIRLGMALAAEEIITVLNKIKYPYNVNILTQELALKYFDKKEIRNKWIRSVLEEKNIMMHELQTLKMVQKVFPSDANFLLVKIKDARNIYSYLKDAKVIVRDRSGVSLCDECLRITVGTKAENRKLISLLREYEASVLVN